MNTHYIDLPPLPEARIVSYQIDSTMRRMELRTYSDEDMRDYARAAIEADRQATCLTCNNNGAVGNILNAEPCPDCTPQPAEPVKCRCGATCQDAGDVCRYNEPMEADTEDLIERLLDAQQDINLAANEHMSQIFCDASALIDEIVQVLHRLSTRPQQIPEGWQLVPKEPTSEMKTAAIGVEVYQESPPELEALTWEEVGAIYRAMLAAAPKPEDTK